MTDWFTAHREMRAGLSQALTASGKKRRQLKDNLDAHNLELNRLVLAGAESGMQYSELAELIGETDGQVGHRVAAMRQHLDDEAAKPKPKKKPAKKPAKKPTPKDIPNENS